MYAERSMVLFASSGNTILKYFPVVKDCAASFVAQFTANNARSLPLVIKYGLVSEPSSPVAPTAPFKTVEYIPSSVQYTPGLSSSDPPSVSTISSGYCSASALQFFKIRLEYESFMASTLLFKVSAIAFSSVSDLVDICSPVVLLPASLPIHSFSVPNQ